MLEFQSLDIIASVQIVFTKNSDIKSSTTCSSVAPPPLQEQADPGFPPLDPGQASVKTSVTECGKRGPAGLPGPGKRRMWSSLDCYPLPGHVPRNSTPQPPSREEAQATGRGPTWCSGRQPQLGSQPAPTARHRVMTCHLFKYPPCFLGERKRIERVYLQVIPAPGHQVTTPSLQVFPAEASNIAEQRQTVHHHSLAAWLTYRICEPMEWGFCTTEPWNNLLRSIR